MNHSRVVEILESARGKRILVVGDIMLDRYVSGEVERICPEAPVPVVRIRDERAMLLDEAIVRQRNNDFTADLILGDASKLPVAANSVDIALYVATLHHLSNRESRVQSLDEIARILDDDGEGLVSVWSTEHSRFDEDKGFDTTVTFQLPDGTEVPRYYHIYDPDEFRADLDASGLRVVREWISHGNCYVVVAASG